MVVRLLKSTSLMLFGTLIIRGAVFLLNIYLAKNLGAADFGRFVLIRSFAQTADGVYRSSVGNGLLSRLAESKNDNESSKNKSNYIVIAILILLSWNAFNYFLFVIYGVYVEKLSLDVVFLNAAMLLAISLAMSFSGLSSVVINVSQRYVLLPLCGLMAVGVLALCVKFLKIEHLVDATLLIIILFSVDAIFKFVALLSGKFSCEFPSFHVVIKFFMSVLPLATASFVNLGSLLVARAYVVNKGESGLVELANFDLALQFALIASLVIGNTASVLAPKIITSNPFRFRYIAIALVFNISISVTFIILVFAFADSIQLRYFPQYSSIGLNIKILAFTALIYSCTSIFHRVLISESRTNIVFLSNVISYPLIVPILFFIGVSSTDISVAMVLSQFFNLVILAYLYSKKKPM